MKEKMKSTNNLHKFNLSNDKSIESMKDALLQSVCPFFTKPMFASEIRQVDRRNGRKRQTESGSQSLPAVVCLQTQTASDKSKQLSL